MYTISSDRLVFLSDVNCNGTEDTILDCFHSTIGNHKCSKPSQNVVMIQCKRGTYIVVCKSD